MSFSWIYNIKSGGSTVLTHMKLFFLAQLIVPQFEVDSLVVYLVACCMVSCAKF